MHAGQAYTVAAMGPSRGLRLQALNDRLTTPHGMSMVRVIQASLKEHQVTVDEIEDERADKEDKLADRRRQDRDDGCDDSRRLLLDLERWLAGVDHIEGLAQLIQQGQRLAHGLQLVLDEGAHLGGAPEPIGDRCGEQCK